MKNPAATLIMENGAKIVLELLPEAAPNTVNSFLYAARQGFFDHHAVERIVPGSWIDMSYRAFGHERAKYLLPLEFSLHPEIEPLDSGPGCVCMGGYRGKGLAGCEFFFPLRECPEHKGIYPVFGKVTQGIEELYRLEKVPTVRITDYPDPDVVVNRPVKSEILREVKLELHGMTYPNPVVLKNPEFPECWQHTR